jgi:hypothetical protein
MPTLAREFNISLSTVHDYIEEQRKLLRAQTIDLATQECDQALQLIDNAIEKVVPHINGQVIIETEMHRVIQGTTADFQDDYRRVARPHEGMSGFGAAPRPQSETAWHGRAGEGRTAPVVVPETEEQRARAREALKTWTKFCVDPKDFQSRDLS